MAQIKAPLYEEKVVDFILELTKVTDKSVTTEEMMAAIDAEEEGAPEVKKKSTKKAAPKKTAAKKEAPKKAAPKKDAPKKTAAKKPAAKK